MRIAMFGHKRIPSREGGVEIVAEELSVRMAALGHDVVCYNRDGRHISGVEFGSSGIKSYKNVTLKTVPTIQRRGFAAASSSFFAALFSTFSKAEVVHIHAEGPAFMCWIPKLFGKRIVVTIHGLDWQRAKWKTGFAARYIHWGEKMAAHFADEIIVLSKNLQSYFENTYGRKTKFIPNGVDKPQQKAADIIYEEYKLKKDEYILFLGRLVPEKGAHYLMEAYEQINTEKKLVIAGCASDSDAYVQELKKQGKDNPNILFTGFVEGEKLEELYSNAYVYVLPSDLEGMSLSLLEAMSYGNCCVVSDIPECTEVVEDKAVKFPQRDVPALSRCLQQLCDDPALVAKYKAVASDFICQKYNWNEVVKKTLELYQ